MSFYMGYNNIGLSVLAILSPTSTLIFDIIEVKIFVIVYHNIVILSLMLLIKSISTFI